MTESLYSSVFANPLNLILIAPIVYLLNLIIFPSIPPSSAKHLPSAYDPDVYNWLPAKHPEVIIFRKYTAKELSAYDGKDGGRICLAILKVGRDGQIQGAKERTVFDVSSGRGFYGPGELFQRVLSHI